MAQIRKAYSVTVETETRSVFPTEKHMKSTLMEVEVEGREEVIFGVCFFFWKLQPEQGISPQLFRQNKDLLISLTLWLVMP